MRNMDHIELHRGGREEAFPETAEDWPYIAERAEFARYPGNSVPWHWHSEVELFYMEQGAIDYRTRAAHEHVRFEEGSAGFINGGVLHSTLQSPNSAPAIQMLHIFQPSMLGDPAGRLQKTLYQSFAAMSRRRCAQMVSHQPRRYALYRFAKEFL